MLNRKIELKIIVILTIIVFGSLGWNSNVVSAEKKIILKMAHHATVGGLYDNTSKKFAELLQEKTKGRVEVQIFPAAQLGAEREVIDGLHLGTHDIGVVGDALMDRYQPFMDIGTLPYLFTSWKAVDRWYNGPGGERIKKLLLEKSNIRLLDFIYLGFRDMLFVGKKIVHLSELKGLKMRAPESWAWLRMYELLGAKATPITWSEVYTALQTKVVDGMDSPQQLIIDMKFYEVTKHVLLTHNMFSTETISINNNLYNRLPADIRKAIDESAKEATEYMNWKVTYATQEDLIPKLKKLGLTVSNPTPSLDAWKKAVLPQHDEWAKKRGPIARELLEMAHKIK